MDPREYPRDDGKLRHWHWSRTWCCTSCPYTCRRRQDHDDPRCPHHGDTMKQMPWKFKTLRRRAKGTFK